MLFIPSIARVTTCATGLSFFHEPLLFIDNQGNELSKGRKAEGDLLSKLVASSSSLHVGIDYATSLETPLVDDIAFDEQ